MSVILLLFSQLTTNSASLAAQEISDHNLASPEAYTLHRILRGVPEGQTEIPPMLTYPMDANLDVMGGRNSTWLSQPALF